MNDIVDNIKEDGVMLGRIELEVQNRKQKIIELVTLVPVDIHIEDPQILVGRRFVSTRGRGILSAPCRFADKEYPIIETITKVIPSGYKHNYLKSTHGCSAWDVCYLETE